jgi:hypothetical protein
MRVCMPANFLHDVTEHTMEIRQDKGEYRHLTFSKKGDSAYKFHLTTWPGYLCISGDMGCYVFSRLRDMFEFFRADWRKDGLYKSINPDYWGEKVQAGNLLGITRFNPEDFKQTVNRYTRQWMRDHYHETTRDERKRLMQAIEYEVFSELETENRDVLMHNAIQFTHKVTSRLTFKFQDFWENTFQEYTYEYLWCCYAIAWGINVYDETKQQRTTV